MSDRDPADVLVGLVKLAFWGLALFVAWQVFSWHVSPERAQRVERYEQAQAQRAEQRHSERHPNHPHRRAARVLRRRALHDGYDGSDGYDVEPPAGYDEQPWP